MFRNVILSEVGDILRMVSSAARASASSLRVNRSTISSTVSAPKQRSIQGRAAARRPAAGGAENLSSRALTSCMPRAVGQRRRKLVQPRRRNVQVGEAAIDGVGRACARAGQRQIGSSKSRRSRQHEAGADVGKITDRDFRHGDRRALGDDTVRRVRRKADAAAHDDAVHQRDHRLGIARDQDIQTVFGRPEFFRQVAARLRRIVERADIAAGGKSPSAGAVEQDRADGWIVRPGAQQRRHGGDHVERDGVERLRPVERDAAQRAVGADDDVAVLKNLLAHRPTRLRATIRRMISLVPSRIWCTRRSRTIFSTPNSAK